MNGRNISGQCDLSGVVFILEVLARGRSVYPTFCIKLMPVATMTKDFLCYFKFSVFLLILICLSSGWTMFLFTRSRDKKIIPQQILVQTVRLEAM